MTMESFPVLEMRNWPYRIAAIDATGEEQTLAYVECPSPALAAAKGLEVEYANVILWERGNTEERVIWRGRES